MARKRRSERVDPSQMGSSLFLGAVVARRSDDEEAPMAAEFSLLIARFNQLLNRYHDGEIGGLQLAEALAEETVVDIAGGVWTLGATSGVWYRKMPSMDWAQVPPPGPDVKPQTKLVVSEEGTVHDNAVSTNAFAELYAAGRSHEDGQSPEGEQVVPPEGDQEWMADSAPDAGWVAKAPELDDLTEVVGSQISPPPTPPTPVGTASGADPLDFLSAPKGDTSEREGAAAAEEDADELIARWLGSS